jgi:hypothetical protein
MARFIAGLVVGALAATALAAFAQEITITLKNGTLHGWTVVRDNETLLCEDPTLFIRARQIQCP